MNRSRIERMSLQCWGLDVRTWQRLAIRKSSKSNRVELKESEPSRAHVVGPAAVPTGKVGWLVLKSTARVPGLRYHAGGPGGRTDITGLIVGSIKSAARQAQPCWRTYQAVEKGWQSQRQGDLDSR